jgi:peptidoglycan/LPS O-acetylase OafA/YrhL
MRLEGIDILRGTAVSTVILYHFYVLLNLSSLNSFTYIHSFGEFGVSLFFIISGYLIYRSIDYSTSRYGVKTGLKYYISHRLFRILPAYYFNFFIVFIIAFYFTDIMNTWPSHFINKQILAHLSFTSFFIYKISGLGINGAYWTLSIEMLWYIVTPLLFIFIKKDRYLVFLFMLSLLYLIALDNKFLDTILYLNSQAPNYNILLFYWSFQLPGQLIYFISGVFIYKYFKNDLPQKKLIQYFLFLHLMLTFIYLSSQKYFLESFTIRNSITLIITALIFMLFYRYKLKELSLLAWIGKISYSLYLWHMPLLFLINKYILPYEFSFIFITILFLVLLFSISALSYYVIEEGGFHMRKKFESKMISGQKK